MKKKSHARYYQNLLHRYLGFKPKLTVLSTRDSDFLHPGESLFLHDDATLGGGLAMDSAGSWLCIEAGAHLVL